MDDTIPFHTLSALDSAALPPPPPPLPPASKSRPPPPVSSSKAPVQILKDPQVSRKFVPFHLFTYGTLMDPQVLQTLLRLPAKPLLLAGSISGFTLKLWGIYPALLQVSFLVECESPISGVLFLVETPEQWERLKEYETNAYTWCDCDIKLESGKSVGGRTFIWRGDPNSKEIEDGDFDFERWKKYFKASVVRDETSCGRVCDC